MKIVKNDLFDYKNRHIFQYEGAFKFSLDSILLGEFVKVVKSDSNIIDFCTGNAPIPLMLTTKFDINITGFEIQKEIYDIAVKSIQYNNLENKIKLINDSVLNVENYYKRETVDIIICNPPYFKVSDGSLLNNNDLAKVARHEIALKLEDIFNNAIKVLKNNGVLYLVHRSERIDEIIITANKYKLNVKEIIFVATSNDNMNTVLVKCVKNSNRGVKVYYKNVIGLKSYKNIFERN